MTTAVCYKCGKTKSAALVPCPECNSVPETEDDIILSICMTDQYFNKKTLRQIADQVKAGHRPQMDDESVAGWKQMFSQMRKLGLFPDLPGQTDQGPPQPPQPQ